MEVRGGLGVVIGQSLGPKIAIVRPRVVFRGWAGLSVRGRVGLHWSRSVRIFGSPVIERVGMWSRVSDGGVTVTVGRGSFSSVCGGKRFVWFFCGMTKLTTGNRHRWRTVPSV